MHQGESRSTPLQCACVRLLVACVQPSPPLPSEFLRGGGSAEHRLGYWPYRGNYSIIFIIINTLIPYKSNVSSERDFN